MRAWTWLPILLMACDMGPPPVFGEDTASGDPGCARADWVPASSAQMSISALSVDASTRIAYFQPGATYEGHGPSACVDPDGGGARFIFTVGDEPFGAVTLIADETGSLSLADDGTFQVEIFGHIDEPVTFEPSHFVFGGWDVQSLLPLQTTVTNASGQKEGRLLTLSFVAEASP